MMKTFLLARGTGNEDFRFPLRSVKQKLEHSLLDIGIKDKDAANKHMSDNKLTYKDICTHAEDTYRTLFDCKEWPPARHVHDSKAPPASFNLADAMPMTRSEVMLLIQSKSPGTGGNNKGASSAKTGNCHKCGKPGHWSRECPNGDATNDNGGSGGRPARNGNGGRMSGDRAGRAPTSHGNRSAPSASNPTLWKTVAPPVWHPNHQAAQQSDVQLVLEVQALDNDPCHTNPHRRKGSQYQCRARQSSICERLLDSRSTRLVNCCRCPSINV